MQRTVITAVLLLSVTPLFGLQSDAKALLRDAAARYRNAKSFRIEFEAKITSSTPFPGGWSRQSYMVAAADQKYHWESEGAGTRRIRVSDGQSDWFYAPSVDQYSIQSADSTRPRFAARGTAAGTTESWVKASRGQHPGKLAFAIK
ncbi:MAG TPA: hypothetical protein VMX38_12695 [Verrucomicrobiae bacterium]|jgi:outer membrane lipoprotein-sorting protein|nr:hypothetical protein [Verrucomicrobiae bacterium]